jgi:hypothetical protein
MTSHGRAGSSVSLIFLIGAMTRPLDWAANCCMAESRTFPSRGVLLDQPQGHPGFGCDLAHLGGVQPALLHRISFASLYSPFTYKVH